MFQYLANGTSVGCNKESDVTAGEGEKLPAAMFCHQALGEFGSNFEAVGKLPISSSKFQVIAKEFKLQGHPNDLISSELKPHSTPATLLWLEKNYELAEGICIPRNTLYSHYIHFCKSNLMSPLNSASFGKIIRQAFPSLTTRRLGTRGQSRYHYYGIAIKNSSPYYDIAFSKMSFSCENRRAESGEPIIKIQQYRSPVTLKRKNKEAVNLWPQFPNMKEISFPPHVPQEKVTSFIIMYHTHCQRIFDIIVRGTLNDAYQFLEHFWQEVPPHLSELLNTTTVINMVGVCDSILYRTINSALLPSVFKSCSENLIHMIRNFADKLENWISSALCDVPANLKFVKLKLGKRFCATLRRQVVLYQLTRTAQVIFNSAEIMNHISTDWKKINLRSVMKQALLFTESRNDYLETVGHIKAYWESFYELIRRRSGIEKFTEKLENLVHGCIVETSRRKQAPVRKFARSFILLWHAVGTLISRDMTIHSAASFGSFHLIQIMFDEYTHYLIEMLSAEDVTKCLLKSVTLDVLPDLDFSWNEFNNGFNILESPPNQRSAANLSSSSLEVIASDIPTNNLSLYSTEPEFNFAKINGPRNDCSYINISYEYQNGRKEGPEDKYNGCDSFSGVHLTDFNSTCDQECVEFSAGIYCQDDLHYIPQNMQYQSSSYCEGNSFECLE